MKDLITTVTAFLFGMVMMLVVMTFRPPTKDYYLQQVLTGKENIIYLMDEKRDTLGVFQVTDYSAGIGDTIYCHIDKIK